MWNITKYKRVSNIYLLINITYTLLYVTVWSLRRKSKTRSPSLCCMAARHFTFWASTLGQSGWEPQEGASYLRKTCRHSPRRRAVSVQTESGRNCPQPSLLCLQHRGWKSRGSLGTTQPGCSGKLWDVDIAD